MIRVILVDDHNIVREGIKLLLSGYPDISVVAEADNGLAGLKVAAEVPADVVLMDVSMPGMNGIEATRILKESGKPNVVMLSMHSDKHFVMQAMKAGAKGYLLKDCASEDLVKAVRSAARDEVYLCSKVTEIVVNDYITHASGAIHLVDADLSPREREILQLVSEGKNTKEIAFTLDVSAKTVETHRRQIMRKLNLYSVAELTKYALRRGFTSLE